MSPVHKEDDLLKLELLSTVSGLLACDRVRVLITHCIVRERLRGKELYTAQLDGSGIFVAALREIADTYEERLLANVNELRKKSGN